MAEFLLALCIFLISHVLPSRAGLRERLVGQMGRGAYLISYALVSLLLLGWLISAAIRAPVVPLWPTTIFHYHLTLFLMFPASILLVGGAASANPFSISFRSAAYDPGRPGIIGVTRHPLLWGFAIWALTHLLANGDLVSFIMFGVFTLFALMGMPILDRRKRRELGDAWPKLARSTSLLPFGAWLSTPVSRRWRTKDLLVAAGGGSALYFLLLKLHPLVIGPDPAAVLL